MRFLLVPHEVTDTTANIWVGVLGEDDKDDERLKSVSLEYSANNVSNEVKLDAQGWKVWKTWNDEDKDRYRSWAWKLSELRLKRNPEIVRTLNYQVITIPSLEPGKTYSLKLRVDSNAAASSEGQVATLPDKLPGKGQKPFTILLGSCFYGPNDTDGLVGATYHHIPPQQRPDVKILCGDQVYLDNPWRETTLPWYRGYLTPGQFRAKLLERYTNNWTQAVGDDAGFRRLLKDGANYFCSDDHEFWNNAPDFGGVGLAHTITQQARDWWLDWAKGLLSGFQYPSPLTQFQVPFEVGRKDGPCLSVCIADTRINRLPNGEQFMNEHHLEAVGQWIRNLRGPGILVLGQPVLARGNTIRSFRNEGFSSGIRSLLGRGRERGVLASLKDLGSDAVGYFDRGLPDYPEQYNKLMEYIRESLYSIVVFTGDVHFARVAYLGSNPLSRTKKLIEVISSPTQVVTGLLGKPKSSGYKNAPSLDSQQITSQDPFQKRKEHVNHFATIEFSLENSANMNMTIKYWPILSRATSTPRHEEPIEFSLPLEPDESRLF